MTDDKNPATEAENEEDFASMLEQSLSGNKGGKLDPGQKIEAKVTAVTKDWVFLDVGQKGEGVIDRKEFLDAEGNLTIAEGETVPAYFVSREGGELRFTTRVGAAAGRAELEEAWRSGIPVEGRIEKEIKGGFEVRLAGNTRAFCPYSQSGQRRGDDPNQMIGQALPVRITQYTEQGRNIVVSHRAILDEERAQQRERLQETLKEGDTVRGTVASLQKFGAFIDIGGIEGLLPISEIAWGRIEDPADVLSVGQELELVVKSLDWEQNRFSFSRKDTLADPWEAAVQDLREGSVVSGTVSRLAPFGAFVTLLEGVDGLLHISKLGAGKRINHPREVVNEGQQVTVKVEKVERDSRRISLAMVGEKTEEDAASQEDISRYAKKDAGGSMGTLGDLLRGSLDAKKKKKK